MKRMAIRKTWPSRKKEESWRQEHGKERIRSIAMEKNFAVKKIYNEGEVCYEEECGHWLVWPCTAWCYSDCVCVCCLLETQLIFAL